MDIEAILAISLIFGGGTAFLLSISPIGRAIADRIRGRVSGLDEEDIAEIRETQRAILEEMEELRREQLDLAERTDFAERLLAQGRQQSREVSGGDVHS